MRAFLFLILLFSFFLQRCAQVQPPSGGSKDEEAPKVVRAVPPNGSVDFEGNRFTLYFDEYIKTSRLQKELIVSPRIEPPPEVSVEGKELTVRWSDVLQENRTYSFRFGNSIQDITEGNRTDNLVYAFSTGGSLDSLHYQGRVVDARTMEGVEGVLAMLYRELGDSVPRVEKPFYFARTDEKGHFDIPYLAEGDYKFFALKDQNRNQRYDLPNEAIGFRKRPITPYEADSSGDALIRLFTEAQKEQFVDQRSIEPGKALFILKQDEKRVELFPPGDSSSPWQQVKYHPPGSDTAIFWFPDPDMPDSVMMSLRAGNKVLDTFLIRNGAPLLEKEEGASLTKDFKDPLEWNEAAAFRSPHPLHSIDFASIIGVSDSDTVELAPRIQGPAHRKLVLKERKAFLDSGLQLTLLPGAVTDTFGRKNGDTLRFEFEVREKDHYGQLRVMLKTEDTVSRRVIFRVLDKRGNTIRKRWQTTDKRLDFPYLKPGSYRLELILDEMPNGKWDPGKYPDRQPEPVRYYPDTVKVRSNWQKEIEWKGLGEGG